MTLPPASSFAPAVPSARSFGMGGVLHVWNVRLQAAGQRELYFRVAREDDGRERFYVERAIPFDAPLEADPEVIGSGDSFAAAWDDARLTLAQGRGASEGPHDIGRLPAACGSGEAATAPSHGSETRPARHHTCRTAPHAAMRAAAGGHGRPRGLEQMELGL